MGSCCEASEAELHDLHLIFHETLHDFKLRRCLRALSLERPDGKVVAIDAPGQWDTRGDEIDIAASVVFREIAQVCKTLACRAPQFAMLKIALKVDGIQQKNDK